METIAYIDGYNLYYGRLRNTPYKWIDPFLLINNILNNQNPSFKLVKVKYFTAPVKASFASHGNAALQAQNSYHRAIERINDGKLEIIYGFQTAQKANPPIYQKPINKDSRVDVWKFEEKQTDVNIALHMYRDAVKSVCKQQVLVSNDSDLEYALKCIRDDFPAQKLGLITPRKKPKSGEAGRSINTRLSQYCNWGRSYIIEQECINSQLPEMVSTPKKAIVKPSYW